MGTRANALADALEESADQMITAVEDLSDDDWTRLVTNEGRTVNVVVHHVAQSHEAVCMLVDMIIAGTPLPPITAAMIDEGNAQHAAESGAVSKEEALVTLRFNAEQCAAKIRKLDDSDLDRTAEFTLSPNGSISIDGVVTHIMIGHSNAHLESIIAAIA